MSVKSRVKKLENKKYKSTKWEVIIDPDDITPDEAIERYKVGKVFRPGQKFIAFTGPYARDL